jgi:hypothetical protein
MAGVDAEHDVLPVQLEPGIADELQPSRHMQEFLALASDLSINYWLNEWLSIKLMVPYRATHVVADFLNKQGELLPTNFESIHHRDEIIQGLGDLRLGVGIEGDIDELLLGLRYQIKLGLTLPTGNVEPDPFVLGKNGIEHQHMFFGSGTVNPWSELALSIPTGPVSVIVGAAVSVPLYRGEYDYKGSTELSGTLGVQYLLIDSFSVMISQEVYHETPASWGTNEANNSGRTDLLASLNLSWRATSKLFLNVGLRKPYASFSEGHQLLIPIAGNMNFMYDF